MFVNIKKHDETNTNNLKAYLHEGIICWQGENMLLLLLLFKRKLSISMVTFMVYTWPSHSNSIPKTGEPAFT